MSRRSERKAGQRGPGRPKGEERLALAAAARDWQAERRDMPLISTAGERLVGATGLELMHRARVGRHVSARVLCNMVRAGEMVKLGKVRTDKVLRPLTVYALPAASEPESCPAFDALAAVFGAMVRREECV